MGGIASLADRSGTLDPRAIRRMTDALRHRGPDDEGDLELSGGGIAIDPTSSEAFEQAILRLFDPEVRQELADRGRKFIEGTGGFSRESEACAAVIENAVVRSHAAAADRQRGDPVWRRRDHGECASGADDGTRVRSGGRGGTV